MAVLVEKRCPICPTTFTVSAGVQETLRKTCSPACSRIYQRQEKNKRILTRVKLLPNGCALWTGAKDTGGYGRLTVDGQNQSVTHFVMELKLGRKLEKYEYVLHKCDTPGCIAVAGVIPGVIEDHLYVSDQQHNIRDAIEKGRFRMGETHHRSFLTETQVLKIRALLDQGKLGAEIRKELGISEKVLSGKALSAIKLRRTWKHI